MAKRRKTKNATASSRTQIIRTPAPIVRVSVPQQRAAVVQRRAPRRHSGGSSGGMAGVKSLAQPALAGGAVGLVVKSGFVDKMPDIPIVGRVGSAAIALK